MNSFMITATDIEREVEKKIVLAQRFLFTMSDRFKYDMDDRKSRVVIGIDYPENDAPLKISQICISGITYTFEMESGFRQNLVGPIYDDSGVHIGDKFAVIVPFNYQMTCYGEKHASRDLANEALNNATFVGKQIFNSLGIRTIRAHKGHTSPSAQFPKLFSTTVSCESVLEWVGLSKVIDVNQLNILEKIKANINKI